MSSAEAVRLAVAGGVLLTLFILGMTAFPALFWVCFLLNPLTPLFVLS